MVTSISNAQSAASSFSIQIQQQLAQRSVEQSEQQARALRAKAQNAEAVAERARETARSLNVEANEAQGDASRARINLAEQSSLGDVQANLTDLHEQITQLNNTPSPLTSSAQLTPVINTSGQTTGTLVNVTA